MYFILKALARGLILPPTGPVLLAACGALLIARRRRLGWPLLTLGLGLIWLLATPIVADALVRLTEHYPAFDPTHAPNAQAIVVLGGGSERAHAPEYAGGPAADSELLERLSYAAFISRRTQLPVLVSGTPLEALTMKTSLIRDFSVEPRWIDARARDTYENAHFCARLLQPEGIHSVVLVTSSTHMWRAAHEFEDVGFDVVAAPAGMLAPRELDVFRFVPGPTALLRSHVALYELLGEPLRRLQRVLGVRERLDRAAAR